MADFTTRPESLNVEQIMEQIRARIREKRGVDYDERQIQELAKAKLDQLLDPRSVQTDLLDRLKKMQPSFEAPQLPSYDFEDTTLYESTRGLLRTIRRLLNPILKLFFNPNPLISALNTQAKLNAMYAEREAKRDAVRLANDQLHYQILHNLLLEMTRATLEVKGLRMRVESIGSRLEFNERRTRSLESGAFAAVEKSVERSSERPSRGPSAPTPMPQQMPQSAGPAAAGVPGSAPQPGSNQPGDGSASRNRRRRRRRGRRGGGQHVPQPGAPAPDAAQATSGESSAFEPPPKEDLETFGGAESHPSEAELPEPPDSDDPQ
jgi:hypothetical protein